MTITMNDMGQTILADEARIVEAISCGAAWEIWMQVEFMMLARARGWEIAREAPFPGGSPLRLDFILQDGGGTYAVELKVESATNAGLLAANVQRDAQRLLGFDTAPPAAALRARWAIGIAYSGPAKQACAQLAAPPHAIYFTGQTLGVIIGQV